MPDIVDFVDDDTPDYDTLVIDVTGAPLPLNFEGTPPEFFEAIFRRLKGTISGNKLLMGWAGAGVPLYDVGPWIYGGGFYSWSRAHAKYVPNHHRIENGEFAIEFAGTATGNRTVTFPDETGTVALTDDIFIPRETKVLTGTAPEIDWELSGTFVHGLTGNTTYPVSTNFGDGMKITIACINRSTAYTVTFHPSWQWPGGTQPPMPAAAAGATVIALYVIRIIDGEVFGELDMNATTTPATINIGGPNHVPPGGGGGPVQVDPFGATVDAF